MLCQRAQLRHDCLATDGSIGGGDAVRYLQVDSSPLRGRDYEMVVVCSVKRQELARLILDGGYSDGDEARGVW